MKISKQLVLALCGTVSSSIYTGKSYDENGIFDFIIESEQTAAVLQNLNKKFDLDWFRPHQGATYEVGQRVQILTSPKDRSAFAKSLRKAGMCQNLIDK